MVLNFKAYGYESLRHDQDCGTALYIGSGGAPIALSSYIYCRNFNNSNTLLREVQWKRTWIFQLYAIFQVKELVLAELLIVSDVVDSDGH